ncbi:hypothetical protein [Streptomyces yerevanensis]|uniref:hypothetical protein n=1 Tax=Streptomyces yerevanensis TaxID=66378 RepID=UPI0005251110|nr:hypothetical protein [Streptomyces yerevanensis]
MTPRSLDELLAGAEILQDTYDDEDTTASRRRIEREVADTWWRSALLLESSAQQVKPRLQDGTARVRDPLGTAQHEQAGRDLRDLSTLVIRDSRAADHIALLAQSCRVEPASAGSSTAALCLYLMHLQRGELRDAEHWAIQAACLARLENHTLSSDDWTSLLSRPPRQGDAHWYTPPGDDRPHHGDPALRHRRRHQRRRQSPQHRTAPVPFTRRGGTAPGDQIRRRLRHRPPSRSPA